MLRDDTVNMAALLSSRQARLAPRATSISTGAIVGATIGSVAAAVLILLCALPFILRARRRRAARLLDREHGAEGTGEGPASSYFPPSHLAATLRYISRNPFAPASATESNNTASTHLKEYDVEGAPESPGQHGSSLETPQQPPSRAGVNVQHGLPSPVSPPLPAAASFAPPTRTPIADGPTADRFPTGETQASAPALPLQTCSERVDGGFANQTSTDSYDPQAGQAAVFTPEGIAEEPGYIARDEGYDLSRRRSSHISDSVRRLARRASAAVRRASATSDGGRSGKTLRSPSIGPGDVLASRTSAPTTFEPIDTEARGEAYSYYHDVDVIPAPAGTYGPPLSIPTSYAAQPPPPGHTEIFSSPTQHSIATPISPVSPVTKPASDIPAGYQFSQRPTFGLDKGGIQELPGELPDARSAGPPKKRALPEPLQRMDSLPPQAIISDILSPPFPSNSEPSVNPMDIMKPSTDTEMGWMVTQELVKMSSSPSPIPHQAAETMLQPIGQPTPDLTPEPEFMAPPEIEINGQEVHMGEASVLSTPPTLSAASDVTSPGTTPDTRSTPYTSTPSPRPNYEGSDKPDSSPRQFACEECHRIFDQFHKLK